MIEMPAGMAWAFSPAIPHKILSMVEQMNERVELYKSRAAFVRIGSIVKAKRKIQFCNNQYHSPNQQYTVGQNNLSYFIVNLDDYVVLKY